ncbi:hypothetical protein F4779DRAFT_602534 [Xylariaceae sp. FL0662B]|nr:hypothetical protein F4779DRAFT_602534 [Xylariaceae sp. FL0662B]
MRISAVVSIATFVAAASAKCYSSTAKWGDLETAYSSIDALCDQLQGHFDAGQIKQGCKGRSGNKSDEFTVRYVGKDGGSLEKEECRKQLKKEVHGCAHGGKSKHGDFEYE